LAKEKKNWDTPSEGSAQFELQPKRIDPLTAAGTDEKKNAGLISKNKSIEYKKQIQPHKSEKEKVNNNTTEGGGRIGGQRWSKEGGKGVHMWCRGFEKECDL